MKKGTLKIIDTEATDELLKLSRVELQSKCDFSTHESNLAKKELHLFIASHDWQMLDLQLTDKTPLEHIPSMLAKFDAVNFQFKSGVSQEIINMLCKVFPDKQGALRRAFMLKKDIIPILNS